MRRDVVLIVLGLAACGGARPSTPDPPAPATLCAGLDDRTCEDRELMRSICLIEPDHAACAPLRAEGHLPPTPPPLDELLRCWQVAAPRDDVRAPWFCLGPRAVAVHAGARWDLWPHGGWARDDTPVRAAWTAATDDGRQLWLVVSPALMLFDDRGRLAVTLGPGDATVRATVHERRALLPPPNAVCAAARACRASIPRPIAYPDAELEPEPDLVAGRTTLAACAAAWRDAADEVLHARSLQRTPIQAVPRGCGHLDFDVNVGLTIVPPFPMLDAIAPE